MEEDKGKIKLIHIILFGVIAMLGIVFSVVFLNSSKNEYAVSIVEKDNSHIEEKNPNIEKENAKSIEEENKEYFQKEVEIIEEPIITNTGKSKNELTFKEAKIENNKLLIKLELATKSTPIKDLNRLFKVGLARLEIGQDIYSLNENYDEIFEISKLNDNLYEVYLIYDVRGLNVDRNINFIAEKNMLDMIDENGTINKLKYKDLDITFLTIHASKGLGYDNVIILNLNKSEYGFPSFKKTDKIKKKLINNEMYGEKMAELLPPAPYKLTAKTSFASTTTFS